LTSGVFVAGVIQGPKDIPETVAQASGAAAKALTLLAKDVLEREPTIAQVNEKTCVGCFECQRVCPYGAIERREIRDRQGNLIKVVARVNEGICEGCGACVVACKNKSMDLAGFAEEQIFAELAAVM
jgi:heterodisulfide reductase subunit A